MARIDDGRNLLFGILALQNGLVDQADLVGGFQNWAKDRSRAFSEVLIERGALSEEGRVLLDGLVRMHLEKHGGDPERSLAATAVVSRVAAAVDGNNGHGALVEATLAGLVAGKGLAVDSALQQATAPDAPDDPDATAAFGVGDTTSSGGRFRVLRPHARGGIGMVSVALDVELNREVALKEIQPEQADDLASRARFVLEAEVTGRLEHPGVVPVYGLGTSPEGRPYYAMRFVRGESLKEAIDRFHQAEPSGAGSAGERALALRQMLARFLDVCNAVAYAHSRGVIHRDLKPANILLGPYGETLVVDWGLAKIIGRDDSPAELSAELTLRPASASGSSETQAGSAVGTPAYMSPEQAEGRLDLLGPASDIYSLGATLYCLLTGRPPVDDREIAAVLRKVQRGDFPPPRHVDRGVPPALEAIVLKAMELQPVDRYPSAKALGEEVEHWLADEPVRAYREPLFTQLARRARRNKPAVAAAAVLLFSAMTALVANDALVRMEKDRTEQQRRLAVDNFRKADEQRRIAEDLSATLTLDRGLALCERGEVSRGLLWLTRALEIVPSAETELQETLRANIASWRHPLTSLRGILPHPDGHVVGVAFEPVGQSFLTLHRTSDQKTISVRRWDSSTLRPLGPVQLFSDHPSPNNPVQHDPDVKRLSPDRTLILAADGDSAARLWDTATGRPAGPLLPYAGAIICAAFSPDGKRVVFGGGDNSVYQFDVTAGAAIGASLRHEDKVRSVVYGPDGKTILTASNDKTARLWDAATGKALGSPFRHADPVNRVAYRPDGKTIATGDMGGVIHLWDVDRGVPIGEPMIHRRVTTTLVFSPDGTTLVTGGFDNTARLWDAMTGKPRGEPLRHHSFVIWATFSPDGRTIATCGDDNAARLWDAATGRPLGMPLEHVGLVADAAFSPDGATLVTGSWDKEAQVWDTATSLSQGRVFGDVGIVRTCAFSRDGHRMAIFAGSVREGVANVWDTENGSLISGPMHAPGEPYCAAISPDGRLVLTGGANKAAQLWDANSGRPVGEPLKGPAEVSTVAFSPDGATFLVGDHAGVVRFYETASRRLLDRTLAHDEAGRIEAIAFSPDGQVILTGSDDTTARFWNFATGQPLGRPIYHQGSVRAAGFRDDGKVAMTAGWDKAVRLWDVSTGQSVASPLFVQSLISSAVLLPDGKTVLVGCQDGTARIWSLTTGKPISPTLNHNDVVKDVRFVPNHKAVATGGFDGTVRIWDHPDPASGSPERIRTWVEVLTRMELRPDGVIRVLDAREWAARGRMLEELGGAPAP
jgi:WD40 repeat protein/tRNA A-37 threonylcarbamoyl transferase component Bud32